MDLIAPVIDNWEDYEIKWDPSKPIQDLSEPILWYNNLDGTRIPIVSRGDLNVICGMEKSRKSLFAYLLIASGYTQDPNVCLDFQMDLDGDFILIFDTEQPKHRVQRNNARFHKLCELNEQAPDIRMFFTKTMMPVERMNFIEGMIKRMQDHYGRNPGWILVDQIADCSPSGDENDVASAMFILNSIWKWQDMTDDRAAVSTVIHTNRGGLKSIGKLGAKLDKKCDSQIRLELDEDTMITNVKHTAARDGRFSPIEFRQFKDGSTQLIGKRI